MDEYKLTPRGNKNKDAKAEVVERQFYKLWRYWLRETREEDWKVGPHVEEYKRLLSVPFHVWWKENKRRAAGIGYREYAFVPINTEEDFNESNGYPYTDKDDERIYRIGFSTPKHILHEELDKLIDQFHKNHGSGHESYYLSGIDNVGWNRKPTKRTVKTLLTTYVVYKKAQRMEAKSATTKLHEIGNAARLRRDIGQDKKAKNEKDGVSENELMAITVSRYLKWAEEIKAQLKVGEFPYYNGK